MADRFVEVNYSPGDGLTLRFRPVSFGLIPEPAKGHLRAANKELLLALRSFVDEAIQGIEAGSEAGRKPRRVDVRSEE